MRYIFDSREKKNDHIKAYFDKHGIEYIVQKLDVGDYQIEGLPNRVVDRKANLEEVATNLMTRNDSARFWREVRKAHDEGIQLIVLVENGGQVHDINDVVKWRSKYSRATGRRLIDEMIRVERAYHVLWQFCDKRSTARRIAELLTEGGVTDGNKQETVQETATDNKKPTKPSQETG